MLNPLVDKFLLDGCMRCKYGATPSCKVNKWRNELELLRQLLLDSDLVEDLKWGMPCYTLNNKNVIMLAAFKEYCCISFFKGALIINSPIELKQHGENSQSVRILKFTDTSQIIKQKKAIMHCIREAIKIEQSGKKIKAIRTTELLPEELISAFKKTPDLEKAFYNLTPGRQRGYIIFISQPKQSQTRINRIEKCREKILNGVGLHDYYTC